MKQLEKGIFPNENNRLYTAAQVVIQMATRVVEEAEKLKLTDKQWYIAFEDYLNILSCKDHSENNQIEDLKDKYNDMKDKVESQQKLIEALLRAQNIEPDKFIV